MFFSLKAAQTAIAAKIFHRNSARALVARINVLIALGVIEFLGVGFDKAVVAAHFAEVNLRSRHLERNIGGGRKIFDEENG